MTNDVDDAPALFESVSDLFTLSQSSGRTLSDLEASQVRGQTVFRIRVETIGDEDNGPCNAYYIHNGRWCRGSGPEPVEFVRIQECEE